MSTIPFAICLIIFVFESQIGFVEALDFLLRHEGPTGARELFKHSDGSLLLFAEEALLNAESDEVHRELSLRERYMTSGRMLGIHVRGMSIEV